MVYLDGKDGVSYVKRFNVTAITRDKEYDLTKGNPNSKILYITVNPNGESEIIHILLSLGSKAKIKQFDFDFGEIMIKGRSSQGNILSKYPIRKITQKEAGKSTLGARKIWYEAVTGRLNLEGRGELLGEFDTGDAILVLYLDGTYETTDYELSNRYDNKLIHTICKLDPNLVISAVHFNGEKGWTMVKRFKIETTVNSQKYNYLMEHKDSKLLYVTTAPHARVQYSLKLNNKKLEGELTLEEFVDIKGWKAMGNKLSDQKLTDVIELEVKNEEKPVSDKIHVGETIDFDVPPSGIQADLFDL